MLLSIKNCVILSWKSWNYGNKRDEIRAISSIRDFRLIKREEVFQFSGKFLLKFGKKVLINQKVKFHALPFRTSFCIKNWSICEF